jgi:hypothetical protein
MSDELSDHAFYKWCNTADYDWVDTPAIQVWREAKRRAEAQIAEQIAARIHAEQTPCWHCGATKEIK